jgi:hypothetical protein
MEPPSRDPLPRSVVEWIDRFCNYVCLGQDSARGKRGDAYLPSKRDTVSEDVKRMTQAVYKN